MGVACDGLTQVDKAIASSRAEGIAIGHNPSILFDSVVRASWFLVSYSLSSLDCKLYSLEEVVPTIIEPLRHVMVYTICMGKQVLQGKTAKYPENANRKADAPIQLITYCMHSDERKVMCRCFKAIK